MHDDATDQGLVVVVVAAGAWGTTSLLLGSLYVCMYVCMYVGNPFKQEREQVVDACICMYVCMCMYV